MMGGQNVMPFDFSGSEVEELDEASQEEVDDEDSPLDYARAWGLSENFATKDPLSALAGSFGDQGETSCSLPESLTIADVRSQSDPNERLTMANDGWLFLQSVAIPEGPPFCVDRWTSMDLRKKRRILELPLLLTDNEMDMTQFVNSRRFDLATQRGAPKEDVNIELDQGFSWPQRYQDLSQRGALHIDAEKLELPKSGLTFLKILMRDQYKCSDESAMLRAELAYERVGRPHSDGNRRLCILTCKSIPEMVLYLLHCCPSALPIQRLGQIRVIN